MPTYYLSVHYASRGLSQCLHLIQALTTVEGLLQPEPIKHSLPVPLINPRAKPSRCCNQRQGSTNVTSCISGQCWLHRHIIHHLAPPSHSLSANRARWPSSRVFHHPQASRLAGARGSDKQACSHVLGRSPFLTKLRFTGIDSILVVDTCTLKLAELVRICCSAPTVHEQLRADGSKRLRWFP